MAHPRIVEFDGSVAARAYLSFYNLGNCGEDLEEDFPAAKKIYVECKSGWWAYLAPGLEDPKPYGFIYYNREPAFATEDEMISAFLAAVDESHGK